jgi:hypothetical protein
MATSRPTRSLLQEARVIDVSNENVARYFLLLEMAFDTKRRVALIQQTLVDGAVRRMTDGATLAQRLMLVDKRAALLRVTLEAGLVFAQERKTAGFEFLLDICRRALDRDAFVYLVTIRAAHFAFDHWMVVRQRERCANFEVTLETGFRRLSWIYDGAGAPARFDVQTPGTVARLAAHVRGLLYSCALCLTAFSGALVYNFRFCCLQSRVSGRSEIAHDLFVACRAFLRADELRARDAGRSENCSTGRAAGKQNYGQRYCSPGAPQQAFALTENPSS